jgi:hypothetical protein
MVVISAGEKKRFLQKGIRAKSQFQRSVTPPEKIWPENNRLSKMPLRVF